LGDKWNLNNVRIQSKINGTNDDWVYVIDNSTGELSIGSFNPSWYYANISMYAQYGVYNWVVWTQVLEVDILHSLQIVSFSIVPTDDYFWIQFQTNLLNASITIWDDVVDSGTLFSDRIYYSAYEGMHQFARSSLVGAHNITICITSKGISPDKDFASDSYIWWYNFTYVVSADTFTLSEWSINLHLNERGSFIDFYVHTSFENSTVYAYDNGTLMCTATEFTGGVSSYFWLTATAGLHTIVLNITDGTTVFTRTKTYYVPDWGTGGLTFLYYMENSQLNGTALFVYSNWGNCTFNFYLDSSLVATSGDDPGQVFFYRTSNTGTFNLTIVCDGGSQTATIKDIIFTVTEAGTTYVSGGAQYITYGGDVYTVDDAKLSDIEDQVIKIQNIVLILGIVTLIVVLILLLFSPRKPNEKPTPPKEEEKETEKPPPTKDTRNYGNMAPTGCKQRERQQRPPPQPKTRTPPSGRRERQQ